MSPPIAIVGAGPTGLTLARLLECKGIDYVVYERDPIDAPNRAGGSLDIHPKTGQQALRECGLFAEFRKHARYEDQGFRIYDSDGVRHTELDELLDGGSGEDRPEIDRGSLRRILLESIPGEKMKWGNGLERVSTDTGGLTVLRFADGSTESGFKLVVGADGAWSKVRPMISSAKPIYSGKLFIEARIANDSPVFEWACAKAGRGTMSALGRLKNILLQRQGDGSYRVYLGVLAGEDFARSVAGSYDTEALRSLLLSDAFFATWAAEWKEMIRNLENFRSWPLYHLAPDAVSWKAVPGFTLAGDAAHLALPNGEGVNCGMTDAMVLAARIADRGLERVWDAVQEYEKDMMARGTESIVDGIRTNDSMLHEDNPGAFISAFKSVLLGEGA